MAVQVAVGKMYFESKVAKTGGKAAKTGSKIARIALKNVKKYA